MPAIQSTCCPSSSVQCFPLRSGDSCGGIGNFSEDGEWQEADDEDGEEEAEAEEEEEEAEGGWYDDYENDENVGDE